MALPREVYTVITPIPGFIPRQLALDILHSHKEVITLNPLVLDVKQIEAPRNAESDEYFSNWYEITERIQVVPGMGKLGGGKIKFNGCFHDMPWGVQSHIYAPMGIDMRNKYRIGGNQPGFEPPEQQEMGLGAPKDGLYLREDIEFKCNITLVSVVKAQMKAASKDMIARMIKKAELLDAGVLKAMIENGKIKTLTAAESANVHGGLTQQNTGTLSRQHTGSMQSHSPQLSPCNPNQPPMSPGLQYQIPRPMSMQPPPPRNDNSPLPGYPAHWQQQQQQQQQQYQQQQQHYYNQGPDPTKTNQFVSELPAPLGRPEPSPQTFAFEMAGDFYYQQPQQSPSFQASQQNRPHSPYAQSSQGHPSPSAQSSRPTSYTQSEGNGMNSPPADSKGFSNELPTHREGPEDYRSSQQPQSYNPSRYSTVAR
ncbi:uncharacterized protein B0I36DRAFT_424339 [Microdochium trichocladiopsis]|uniref:DUF7053 domain-containing protein n=1 Tax=Microdochium trichocladiopsis TaxID=1682393 RepID=A0A9P8Y0W8_9PEZI|nr:uncharacterized protein B0I36DRAFT_424339 [Microdochium trichocladiopsis]KAH7026673.1 hypothetical protein B0I36DRAFT_424339 [Microdochium trichocladiopsis]